MIPFSRLPMRIEDLKPKDTDKEMIYLSKIATLAKEVKQCFSELDQKQIDRINAYILDKYGLKIINVQNKLVVEKVVGIGGGGGNPGESIMYYAE